MTFQCSGFLTDFDPQLGGNVPLQRAIYDTTVYILYSTKCSVVNHGKSASATLPMQQKSIHCFRACLRTPTRSAKYQVNSLCSFIRSSLEYITLVIQKKWCSLDLTWLYHAILYEYFTTRSCIYIICSTLPYCVYTWLHSTIRLVDAICETTSKPHYSTLHYTPLYYSNVKKPLYIYTIVYYSCYSILCYYALPEQ